MDPCHKFLLDLNCSSGIANWYLTPSHLWFYFATKDFVSVWFWFEFLWMGTTKTVPFILSGSHPASSLVYLAGWALRTHGWIGKLSSVRQQELDKVKYIHFVVVVSDFTLGLIYIN